MVVRAFAGGRKARDTDYQAIVGVARADVARVAVVTADGRTRELPLNRWRAFRYAVEHSELLLATELRAYDADGALVYITGTTVAPPDSLGISS